MRRDLHDAASADDYRVAAICSKPALSRSQQIVARIVFPKSQDRTAAALLHVHLSGAVIAILFCIVVNLMGKP